MVRGQGSHTRLREANPAYQLRLCSNFFRDLMVVPHQPLVTSDETSLSVYPEPQNAPRVGAEVHVLDSPRGVNTRSRRPITIVDHTPRGAHKVTGESPWYGV